MHSTTENLSPNIILDKIGLLVDLSSDLQQAKGTKKALEWCDLADKIGLSPAQKCLLDYFRANAWHNRFLEKKLSHSEQWAWEQPEIERQIYYLRRAYSATGFEQLETIRRCQILTNLANQFNTIGRFIQAIECWDSALNIEPFFGMALGNRGRGISYYAMALYDSGHVSTFLGFAHAALIKSLSNSAKYYGEDASVIKLYSVRKASIESLFDSANEIKKATEFTDYSTGETQEEIAYRQWCLHNVLFLNPLNDVCQHSIASNDILLLPSITTPLKHANPPGIIGFFCQMKQEFASARWLYYEGMTSKIPHFSDKQVLLLDTPDYPAYSLSIEKVKLAYRSAYSIFDKIAFLLNSYFKLGEKENAVNFRGIWYNKNSKKFGIRSEFLPANWPLRGLFWLSKDLFENDFQTVLSPDSKELHTIRNHLEHKHIAIHFRPIHNTLSLDSDHLGYGIDREELESKTLRILKIARGALIYLSLAIHAEENRRHQGDEKRVMMPMMLSSMEDDWKI